MSTDERLSDALHSELDSARPSPELESRILERVSAPGRRTVRFNPRLGVAGAVALLLVLLAVPLGLNLRSNGGSAATGLSGQLTHFDRDGLAFDYPASWKAAVSGVNMHYITILDFLGTGSGLAACAAITPGPSDKFISGVGCGTTINVDPGQVVVEISTQQGPPAPGLMNPIDPSDPSGLDGGGQYVTVGGLPAIFVDGGNTLDWSLPMPEQEIGRYSIHVEIKGPGADLMRAQVMALVASIQFDPPVPVLNPADGPRFAAAALAQVRAQDPAFACFPDVPGTTATATVMQLPMLAKLNKPLPVACGMEIQPTSDGRWKITLVESWTAASDRSAGSMTVIQWLAADGTLAGQNGESFPTDIPYSN